MTQIIVSKPAPGNPCNEIPYGGKKAMQVTNIVDIYNLQGTKVCSKTFKTDKFDLNLSKGIYILNFISTDGYNEKKRIVIE